MKRDVRRNGITIEQANVVEKIVQTLKKASSSSASVPIDSCRMRCLNVTLMAKNNPNFMFSTG